MATTVGRFTVTMDAQGMTEIEGPADYMASAAYRRCMGKIGRGQSAVVNYGISEGRDLAALIAVALQTDYAGWLGMRSFGAAVRS